MRHPFRPIILSALVGLVLGSVQGLRGQEPKAAELNQLRLYVPIPELEKRVGKNVEPLATYIKALEQAAAKCLQSEERPKAKGLLIAVGIKADKKAKVWCQAVDGDCPTELLRKIEKELAKVESIALIKPPMAFGMEIKLWGHKAAKYPEYPETWIDAAKKSDTKLLIPPADLFKTLWPD